MSQTCFCTSKLQHTISQSQATFIQTAFPITSVFVKIQRLNYNTKQKHGIRMCCRSRMFY